MGQTPQPRRRKPTHDPSWDAAIAAIAAGADPGHVIEAKMAADRVATEHYFRYQLNRPDVADRFMQRMRDLDLGLTGARAVWHSISPAQRHALSYIAGHGGRLERHGKAYQPVTGEAPRRSIRILTLRPLAERNLIAWDGGAFDPEQAVVLTERGRFVLKHGERGTDDAP